MLDTLKVLFDTQQPRLYGDRIALICQGDDWDTTTTVNTTYDGITKTVFLTPLPMSPSWQTNSSGNYARLHKSDLTFGSPDKWVESDRLDNGHSNYLQSQGYVESVMTNASYISNKPFYLSYFVPGAGSDKSVCLEFGWGNTFFAGLDTGGGASGVAVRVWTDGTTEVWKDGGFVQQGSVIGKNTKQLDLQTVNLYCIPFRQRELLILSNQGDDGGFTTIFEDIEEDDPNPIITPAGHFWFHFYGDTTIELAPISYFTNGSIASKLMGFAEPLDGIPGSDNEPGSITWYPNLSLSDPTHLNVSLVDEVGDAFTSGSACRFYATFHYDGSNTPVLFAATAETDPVVQDTDGTHSVDVTQWITGLSIDVGDDPSGSSATVTFKNPDAISQLIPEFTTMSNRAAEIWVGDRLLFVGRMDSPHYIHGRDDTLTRVRVDIRDNWKALENYIYSDPKPLDGMALTDSFASVVKQAGFSDANIDIPDLGVTLPNVGTQGVDFNVLVKVTDTSADWTKRLWETYCREYIIGFWNDGVFRMVLPDKNDGATLKIFPSIYDAISDIGADPNSYTQAQANRARKKVCRNYQDDTLEVRANYVVVIGHDPRLDRPIRAIKFDQDSADPSVPPGGRKPNWVGEIRKACFLDATLTTQDDVDDACLTIFTEFSQPLRTAEFESELLIDDNDNVMWRGDVVEIDGFGRYRITGLHGDFSFEYLTDEVDRTKRHLTYTAEFMGDSFTE